MLFNSYEFLFLYFPIVITIFLCLFKFVNKKTSILALLISSLIFYAAHNIYYLFLFLGSIIINYFFGSLLIDFNNKKSNKYNLKIIFLLGIFFNILLLFNFKYYDFFALNILNLPALNFILPIGISFYTFQQIGFISDSYKGKIKSCNFIEYASFVSFFPQLIAGPIVHHSDFIRQIRSKEYTPFKSDYWVTGIMIFILGLFKKIVIADYLARFVNSFYSDISQGLFVPLVDTWLSTISYTLQIYFDFSAYSEMAIGIGLLYGIKLPINFNSPYKSLSLIEYWNRWHITLSNFIRDYLYIPIFIKLSSKFSIGFANHLLAIVISMTISGFWHGANWTFLLWGFVHGIALALNHCFKAFKFFPDFPKVIKRILLLIFINITWVLFRAPSFSEASKTIHSLFPMDRMGNIINQNFYIGNTNIETMGRFIIIFLLISVIMFPSNLSINEYLNNDFYSDKLISIFTKYNLKTFHVTLLSILFSLLFFASLLLLHRERTFLYFQF